MEEPVGTPGDDPPGSHPPTFGSPVSGVAYKKRLAAYAVIRNHPGAVAAVQTADSPPDRFLSRAKRVREWAAAHHGR